MKPGAIRNELYLAVLPLIRMGDSALPIEEVLTLYPDKNFATNFFPDEVGFFVTLINKRFQNLTGGHVTGYEVTTEQMEDGRFVIKVDQFVEGSQHA